MRGPVVDTEQRQLKPLSFFLTMTDIATLVFNLYRASTSEVGYEDTHNTLEEIVDRLELERLKVDKEVVERALWACQMLSESAAITDGFWSPKGQTVEEFIATLLKNTMRSDQFKFNEKYCLFERVANPRQRKKRRTRDPMKAIAQRLRKNRKLRR